MREQLLDRMIRIYGFEHEVVITFAEMCEDANFSDWMLEAIVKSHEQYPQISEDEEE